MCSSPLRRYFFFHLYFRRLISLTSPLLGTSEWVALTTLHYSGFSSIQFYLFSSHNIHILSEYTKDIKTSKSNTVYFYTIIALVKGHLEPTHLKSSPLFTFSTKSLGQDSPSIHLFSKIIRSRFATAKIKSGEDSPTWFVFSRPRFTLKQRK